MNISFITASFPLDEQTYQEVLTLVKQTGIEDGVHYEEALKTSLMPQYDSKGFVILAYDDDKDLLIGVTSAMDIIGLNTYEWSSVVAPMYRNLRIGSTMIEALQEALEDRGCEGELALAVRTDGKEKRFLTRLGYYYNFSEAYLSAPAETSTPLYEIKPYLNERTAICELYEEAFGDLYEESVELIDYTTTTAGHMLFVAYDGEQVVGTVTTTRDGSIQWLSALAVKKSERHKGIGTALISWVKHYALQENCTNVLLMVEMDNEAALRIYEKNRFTITQQTDYYIRKRIAGNKIG